MITEHEDPINTQIATDLIHLMSTIGNLHLHVSGEGKVDFLGGVGTTSGWAGMVSTIVSGDVGCLKPYDNNPKCALDAVLRYLGQLEPVPHLNSSEYEEHVPSPEEWQEFVKGIETDMKGLSVNDYVVKYTFKLNKNGVDVVVVTLKPLCNTFVVGEFRATRKYDFIGQINDYDQPLTNGVVITCEGKDYTIPFGDLVYYRNRRHRYPRKGDYLMKDPDSDKYLVLPQEDYSIH